MTPWMIRADLYLDLARMALADATEIANAAPPLVPMDAMDAMRARLQVLYRGDAKMIASIMSDELKRTRKAEALMARRDAREHVRLFRLAARLLYAAAAQPLVLLLALFFVACAPPPAEEDRRACTLHNECESRICDEGLCVPPTAPRLQSPWGGDLFLFNQALVGRGAAGPLDLTPLAGEPPIEVRIYGGDPPELAPLGIPGQDAVVVPRGVRLTLDGFAIDGAGRAIVCRSEQPGGAAVRVHRSALTRSQGLAIWAAGCDVALDRVLVRDSADGALSIEGAVRYEITNTMMVRNAAPRRPLVWFDNASAGVFAFNTVAGNQTRSGALDCGLLPRPIEDSILIGNTKVQGSQVTETCQLHQVVLDPQDLAVGTQGGIAGTPVFVDAADGDFHLQDAPLNRACCIDRGAAAGLRFDYDGTARPQGAGHDIGAHEVITRE